MHVTYLWASEWLTLARNSLVPHLPVRLHIFHRSEGNDSRSLNDSKLQREPKTLKTILNETYSLCNDNNDWSVVLC
jgi:hypothetical protein